MSTLSTAICISVIDEVSPANATIDADWQSFRTNYPNRTFWILDPEPGGEGVASQQIYTPASYQADPLANGPISVRRDSGVTANRSDWFTICGLNTKPAGTVISLAVDTSGSMTLATVQASYNWFKEKVAAANFVLVEDTVFPDERWIPPHNKVLPPSVSIIVVPNQIVEGASATLSWETAAEAISSTITPDIGTVTGPGSVLVSPSVTTQYSLTTVTATFTTIVSATLFVFQLARVSLSADNNTITAGSCTTLRWNTTGDALSASINQNIGGVNISGNRIVCPTVTTTYTINVTDYGSGDTASVTITVINSNQLNSPNPAPVFNALSNLPLSTPAYSNVVIIQGLTSPANVTAGFGTLVAVRNTNATTTNAAGYSVLTGATFASSATVSNGQYLQLLGTSPNSSFSTTNIPVNIGDGIGVSTWSISTGQSLSTTPTAFSFPNVTNVAPGIQVASEPRPTSGISGLGTGTTVPVELISTTGTTPRIKINNGSIGVFPSQVTNGDIITLYNASSTTLGGNVETSIKVGTRIIPTWSIDTYLSPDSTPSYLAPPNLTNRVPNTFITSAVIGLTDFNVPITINATNGALISIDYDTPVAGPRTYNPLNNDLFYLVVQSSASLNTSVSTTVTVGNAPSFTWSVTTYASAPPAAANLSAWYSIKTNKYDGFSIGTVIQVLKENVVSEYGNIQQRFPGFLDCNGASYSASQYPELFNTIGNSYGGSATYNSTTGVYSGSFNVPDYRNRRICGVGIVDANRGGSTFLPVSTGTINTPGSEGGYWYIDRVDVSGPLPFEQVYGGQNDTTGITSPFFELGTVRTSGIETATTEVGFNINGFVTANINGISAVNVRAPAHTHELIAGQVEGNDGEPLIPWATKAFYATANYDRNPDSGFRNPAGQDGDGTVRAGLQLLWSQLLAVIRGGSSFEPQFLLDGTVPGTVEDLLPIQTSSGTFTSTFFGGNFWASPLSETAAAGPLMTITQSPARNDAGVIDTVVSTFSISPYASPGVYVDHSHLISLDAITNPQTDFTWGAAPGAGTKYQQSLPSSEESIPVRFNQSQVLMDLNDGTFTFNTSIKPIPTVALQPTKTVPIISPFHKVKYIIKAY